VKGKSKKAAKNYEVLMKKLKFNSQGTIICLDSMGNDPNPIPSGTKGTVEFVDDCGSVFCKFDNCQPAD